MLNELNYYTSYSLKFAMQLQNKFDIKINLIFDDKPNAYLYKKEDLISGNKIFGNWYMRLKALKDSDPTNGLIKLLASSGWGHMQQVKIKYVDEPELMRMIDDDVKIGTKSDDYNDFDYIIEDMVGIKDRTRYSLIDTQKGVYDLPLRLLPFITSYSRVKMGRLINKYNYYNNIIRIQTDSIIFKNNIFEKIDGFIKDEKITGNINFKHINNYNKYFIFS